MIRIVAPQIVREDAIEQFEALAHELIEATRAEEGNVEYTLNKNTQNPREYCFIECWKDQAAVESHMQSPHFQQALPQLGALIEEGSSSINIYVEV